MQITRFLSLTDAQLLGCVSAFVDSLSGELNSAAMYLKKLEGQAKGAAFAYEMALDTHRYGALVVLDRWASLAHTYGPHVAEAKHAALLEEAAGRVQSAENLMGRTNDVIDAAQSYGGELVSACLLAWQGVTGIFAEESAAAAEMAKLGPMLPDDYRSARRIFLEDLAAR